MSRRLTLAALAGLLVASACIINTTDDDDSSGDSSNATTTGNGNDSSGSSATPASSTSDANSSTAAPGESTAAAETSSAGGACGWGQTGDADVPEGYICGGEGADPSENFPMDCPAEATLEVGAACAGIEGPGCCDADGNVWFCGDDGSGPALVRTEC
ncbi:MAG: hypothetical protein AAF799_28870 [Myxococcota bacterium]